MTARGPWRALLAGLALQAVGAAQGQVPVVGEIHAVHLSAQARAMVEQVIAAGDSQGLPFVVVDKIEARVIAFDAGGGPLGAAPALLGLARGDISVPGIGTLRLADIPPAQRITPAGRFEAHLGANLAGHRILWIDYDAALSLHPVVTSNAAEHRLRRLATPSVLDNRISYGCINVPPRFYEDVVQPLFAPAGGIVYILPELSAG